MTRHRGLGNWGIGPRSALLTLAGLATWAAVAPVAWKLSGTVGLRSAGLAAASCWAGAMPALVVSLTFYRLKQPLPGLLLGLFFRMSIPLGIGLIVQLRHGVLAQAGFVYYLLVFYPVMLAVEVYLTLPKRSVPGPPSKTDQDPAS